MAVNLLVAAGSANAAYYWLNNLTIKEFRYYHDGAHNLAVYVNEPISTGCAEDSQGLLTFRNSSSSDVLENTLSIVQQAIASGATVNIHYQTSCSTGSGAKLTGIAIQAQ